MAEIPLFTYQDAVDHIRDYFDIADLDVTSRNYRAALRAVDQAYRDLPRKQRWSYYERRFQKTTVAAQSSSTITYDHTGGAYERMVTIASGTWPTDARFYNIIIDQKRYKIEEYKTTAIITLTPDTNPGKDVAAGTSYDLFRSLYPLAVTLRRSSRLVEVGNSYYPTYVSPNKMAELSVGFYVPQKPRFYTFRSSGDYYGGMELEFHPPPLTERTYDWTGEVEPRALTTHKYNTGTVTITGNLKAVTVTTGTLSSSMAGDIMRFSANGTDAPTGLFGDPDGTDKPYLSQRVILSKDSATTCTIDEVASSDTLTNVKYVISSPLDIAVGDMWNYFCRLAELYYMRMSRFDFKIEEKREKMVEGIEALRLAMVADNKDRDAEFTGVDFYTLEDRAVQ